jgi:solute carrier family 25 phosphate transporter 3
MVSNVDSKGLSPFQILYLHILHTKSALSIFDGLVPILIKQIPETFVKQLVFDYVLHYARVFMQSIVSQYHLTISTDMQGMMIRFISAFITAILSCLVSHPGDTILTNTHNTATLFPSQQQQQQSSSAIKRELTNAYSTKEVISQIYSKYGLGGFMLGVEARLMHVVSIVTIQLVIYDLIKQKLGIPVVTSL